MRVLISIFILATALLFQSTSIAKVIELGFPIAIKHKDPINLSYVEEWEAYWPVHETLIRNDINEDYIPSAAKKWVFNTKNNVLTFWLRKDLKFSDGSRITSTEVTKSLKRILIIDKERTTALSRCFEQKKIKVIKDLNSPFENFKIINQHKFEIKFDNCSSTILPEFANSSYGIVSTKALNKDLMLDHNTNITSGMYSFTIKDNIFQLIPNKHSFWWKHSTESVGFNIVKWDGNKKIENWDSAPDILRLSSSLNLKQFKKRGFHVKYSLPIMTWFLTPAQGQEYNQDFKAIINDLNKRLDTNNISYFRDGFLEKPANSFFPKEFNCIGSSKPQNSKFPLNKLQYKSKPIYIYSHESGESDSFAEELVSEIKKLGYNAFILKNGEKKSKEGLHLLIERQFLGDDLPYLFSILFNTFKTIPDPDNYFKRTIKTLEEAKKSERDIIIGKLCTKLDGYYHVPLAHRKYAFISNNEDYLNLFSKITGNLFISNITNISK